MTLQAFGTVPASRFPGRNAEEQVPLARRLDELVNGGDVVGIDPLVLRAPLMRIGNQLLVGNTTITPRFRYLTFVSWITLKYWKRRGKDTRASYREFARRLEAAIVLGDLAVALDTTGRVGLETQA